MTKFLSYAIPGIPYGCNYALMAVGLVLTYRATGVFNLAFGAQAFLSAFVFDLLVRTNGLPRLAAFAVSVLGMAPLVGLALDRFLFRHIPTASTTAKVISTLGLLIAIPQAIPIIWGGAPRPNPPVLWLNPAKVYFHVFSTPINGGDVATTVVTVGVVVVLGALMRFTGAGLAMRAVVESRRLAQLDGVNAGLVAAAAWMLSSALAGLAGVLMLSIQPQLEPSQPLEFTALLVAGVTAAAIASLRSLPRALAGGVLLGVLQSLLPGYLPQQGALGTFAQHVEPALPFVVLVLVLLANPELGLAEVRADPLASCDPPPPPPSVTVRDPRLAAPMRVGFWALVAAFVASTSTWVPGYWVFALAEGLALSVLFLSITLVTGMSGQLSLCQATFAGAGAFVAGQLAVHHGVPVLLGGLLGALVAAAFGLVIALLATRLAGLVLTLATLAFALFADNVLFQYSWFGGGLSGVTVPRPRIGPLDFADDRSFVVLLLVVLAIVMLGVLRIQRGTTGRFLAAIRASPVAAANVGIDLTRAKVIVFCLSAAVAGYGGALYGSLLGNVSSQTFTYEYSLAFAVMVITTGVRTVEGAVQAGMAFAVFNQILVLYLPRFQGIVPILFALGAFTYAAHPEGIVEYQRTKWLLRVSRLLEAWDSRRGRPAAPGAPGRRALEPATEGPVAAGEPIGGAVTFGEVGRG
jgi:branched-chain amino acid transport system permease protein